jgi:hypothetical protein
LLLLIRAAYCTYMPLSARVIKWSYNRALMYESWASYLPV